MKAFQELGNHVLILHVNGGSTAGGGDGEARLRAEAVSARQLRRRGVLGRIRRRDPVKGQNRGGSGLARVSGGSSRISVDEFAGVADARASRVARAIRTGRSHQTELHGAVVHLRKVESRLTVRA